MRTRLLTGVLALLALASLAAAAGASEGYLRYPDIHGDRIVFVAESDLWICSDDGGAARRLTSFPGREYHPRFSPDGEWIAFTGEYDGNRDVYLIPAVGGEPQRLTWHPDSDEVVGWTPDGRKIIFRSYRESPFYNRELYTVPARGGAIEKLPLGWAARIDMDPDSGLWAFNRTMREYATWKRYRGGTAETIWVGHPDRADFHEVTTFEGTNAWPMWHGGRIYYVCDKGGTYNIWSMEPDGSDAKRHTNEGKWDVRWPGMGPDGRIVYMLAGGLKLYDPERDRARELDIDLPSERVLTRRRYPDPGRWLEWFDLSPEGDRLAVVTRGEIFSVPVEEGVTLPVTRGSGAREGYVQFDREGERVLYLTDASGEEEFQTADAWGRGDVKTVHGPVDRGFHFAPRWSPDGKWIAYGNSDNELRVIPAEGGRPKTVDTSGVWFITDYFWSPDGRWLAYGKYMDNEFQSIFLYDTQEEEVHRVTGDFTDDHDPSWDPDGRYLYFLSDRSSNPVMGTRDWNVVEVRNTTPFMILLQEDGENPFLKTDGLPPDDEEEDGNGEDEDAEDDDGDEGEDEEDDGEDEDEEELEPVEIDLAGLGDRVIELDVPVGRYYATQATASKLFYMSGEVRGRTEERGPGDLMTFDLEEEEAELFASGVQGYMVSNSASKVVLAMEGQNLHVVDAGSPPGGSLGEHRVDLSGIVLELHPREEWKQIYHEAWRRMRDRYWDEDMGGLDWKGIRDQYAALLPRLSSRDDLSDLIGEVIGELSTSHTYVWGGDPGVRTPRVGVGMLGADLVREGEALRVARIYRGGDADNVVSPLRVPGVDVKEGEYILAVNGLPVPADRAVHAAFEGLLGKDVLLTVAADAAGETDRRDVVVTPTGNERRLRYADWVRVNREYVDEKTGGKIGYVHVPDMGTDGLVAFNTWFYPQTDKEGMVVDVRWNGGGNVSSILLERLRRPILAWDRTRAGNLDTYPGPALNGPFVVLLNEHAGSDGDIFPRAVQLEGLAPIIGQRSWGGVIGINIMKTMVDGGVVTTPFSAWWDKDMGWGLENHGVDPDIEVQNLPQELARGIDAQLDAGIEEVLRLHREHPPIKPDFERVRDRSRDAYRGE